MLPLILIPDSTYTLRGLVAWLATVLVHAESTCLNSPIERGRGRRKGRKQWTVCYGRENYTLK